MNVCGIVLAGGKSTRMGKDKAMLQSGSETMLMRAVKEMFKFTDQVIIASHSGERYSIPGAIEVKDRYAGQGPLAGIHAGLTATEREYAFVVAVDMPFFRADLARFLLERKEGYDVVVPVVGGYAEPLCAVYSRRCIGPIEELIERGRRKVVYLYDKVRVLKVKEEEWRKIADGSVFTNINTPQDYLKYCQRKTE